MKRKVVYIPMFLLFLAILFFMYYIFFIKDTKATNFLEKEELAQANFLNDKQGVIYFSTTADQDMDGKGISYAVFINHENEAKGYKMQGLELGGVGVGENKVLLQDKHTLTLVGEKYRKFQFNQYQHTGELIGYLENQKIFFSIYNSGLNSKTGTYDSNVLFGNKDGFKEANIPSYLATSGIDKEGVVFLTNDIEANKYDLKKVIIKNNQMLIKEIVQLSHKNNVVYSPLSSILSDDKYYYFVLDEVSNEIDESTDEMNMNTVLFRINQKTLGQEKIIITTQNTVEEESAAIPFNTKNSAYIFNNNLYYMDGQGRVFSLEQDSNVAALQFTIDNPPNDGTRYNEQLFFKHNYLYVLRYNKEKDVPYFIETYSLETGKKDKVIEIKDLDKILNSVRGKSIYSYDFKILN